MDQILERGKVYVGPFPRLAGESLRDYFARILRPLKKRGTRKGLILILRDLPAGENPESVVHLWQAIQDEAS